MIPAPHWRSMLELLAMLRPQGHLWDIERRRYLHRSIWWSQALCRDYGFAVKKENSHCLKDFSELRALCVDICG